MLTSYGSSLAEGFVNVDGQSNRAGIPFKILKVQLRSSTACLAALLAITGVTREVRAQEEPASNPQSTETEAAAPLESVVVTGSRIIRNGYNAPTPLTVVGEDEVKAAAPRDISDYVNQLPSLVGSFTPTNETGTLSAGQGGINALNLRGIGTARTLVLLDGQRSVAASQTNLVDVGAFPQQLIKRVDIVTGGASAAYGSDALSGVVNFILDKEFVGFKAEASGGITTYGDDPDWDANFAYGTAFANGRGHLLLSGEVSKKDGILGDLCNELTCPPNKRPWLDGLTGVLSNPAYNASTNPYVPQYLVRPNFAAADATYGGIITSGPLRGTAFGPGGTPYQFNYGTVGGVYMSGGDYRISDVTAAETLDPRHDHQDVFTRASYDLTDNLEAYVQLSWDRTYHESYFGVSGELNTLVLHSDNPYIPASITSKLPENSTFDFGSWVDGLHEGSSVERQVQRYVTGLNGRFDMFAKHWTWDAYYQLGITGADELSLGNKIVQNYDQAIDAVTVTSANVGSSGLRVGSIACRSTLSSPNNGCVPFNVFGQGVASQAALDYITNGTGSSSRYERLSQNVASATLHGEPVNSWAGPVSIATGVEWRREAITGHSDPYSLEGAWYAANFRPTIGSYDVTEGFVETVIPLAADMSWTKSLDFNGAFRATGYSTSGYVSTWKLGLTWSPIEDIRFRATRSRDIRAPNLSELFTTGIRGLTYVRDPFSGNLNAQAETITTGNLDLKPEVADTTGFGVVLQPKTVPGFSASIDYYNISISDAIGSVATQQVIDNCYAGYTVFCSGLTRELVNGVSTITKVYSQPFNFANELDRGIDFEASYHISLDKIAHTWHGDLAWRFLATRYLKDYISNGINLPVELAGENSASNGDNGGLPNWKFTTSLAYNLDPVTVTLTGRGVSAGKWDSTYIACNSSCPVSTVEQPTIDYNRVSGVFYLDASFNYKFTAAGAETELFLSIENALNRPPPIVPAGPDGTVYADKPTYPILFDDIGRVFRVGVRLKM